MLALTTARAAAQTAPAAQKTSPDETPSIKVGALIFTDYTTQLQRKTIDADGNAVTFSSFNVGRSYINLTGSISHLVSFRLTQDVTRESGTGGSLNGSYTFRLKYAFAQLNLEDWMRRGSWLRLGIQQTPWIEFIESVYRYRFQSQAFPEREGFIFSSDAGAVFHSILPSDHGDFQAGIYNGEGYQHAEVNAQKAFMVRGTLRPLPRQRVLRGLRLTGFWNRDAYALMLDLDDTRFARYAPAQPTQKRLGLHALVSF